MAITVTKDRILEGENLGTIHRILRGYTMDRFVFVFDNSYPSPLQAIVYGLIRHLGVYIESDNLEMINYLEVMMMKSLKDLDINMKNPEYYLNKENIVIFQPDEEDEDFHDQLIKLIYDIVLSNAFYEKPRYIHGTLMCDSAIINSMVASYLKSFIFIQTFDKENLLKIKKSLENLNENKESNNE